MPIRLIKSIILLLIFFCSNIIIAQEIGIQGRIINQVQKPVTYSNIFLLNKDNKIIRSTMSNHLGMFYLSVERGDYTLQVHVFNQIVYSKKINIMDSIDIGLIEINELIGLDEITIEGRKKLIERKVDRLVFNAENSVAAAGGNALDVLKITPGLIVQNNSISIIGKSTVSVMINGSIKKMNGENLISYLRGMNGGQIKSVEVITNPSAKYSAEGNSGIIHIILKKEKTDNWSNSISTSYSQSKYGMIDLYDNFTYKKNKLTIAAGVSYTNGIMNASVDKEFLYPEQTFNEENIIKTDVTYFIPQIAVDYEISKRTKMGVQYEYFLSDADRGGNKRMDFRNLNNTIDSLAVNNSMVLDKSDYHAINYFIDYKIDTIKGRKLRLDFDIFNHEINQNTENNNHSYLPSGEEIKDTQHILDNGIKQKNTDYTFKLDMIHPIRKFNLNYGANVSFLKISNHTAYSDQISSVNIIDDNLSNEFNYKENTQSFYFSVNKNFNDQWAAQAGLRIESSQTSSNSITTAEKESDDYKELFPTAYISYNPHEKHSFNLNYGRRINRPHFMLLNPFKSYLSPYSYTVGNPLLKPSFSNNLELSYLYNQSLNFQLYYHRIHRNFNYLTFVNPKDLSYFEKPENYLKEDVYGITISYNYSPINWWETFFTLNYNYSSASSYIPEIPQALKGNNSYSNFNNTFHIKKNISFNMNYYYYFSGINALQNNASRNHLDLSLRMRLLNERLDLVISANDIFKTNQFRSYTYSNDIKINSNIFVDNSYRISLNYKFGNKSIKKYQYSDNENQFRM